MAIPMTNPGGQIPADFSGRHVVVVGLGKSGLAMVRFLLARGARVSVSEGGRAAQLDGELYQWLQEKGVKRETGGHSSELFLSGDLIAVSPGVPLDLPALAAARQEGIAIIGELGLAAQYLAAPAVAITGTNGKSTVTSLVGDLCQAAGKHVFVGGNIGTPLTEYVAGRQEAEIAVLEVSSFQLDTAASFRPEVAVLLNISPDHLDRYPSYEAYADSKFRIFANQGPEDAAILNADDPEIMSRLGDRPTGRQYFFGRRLAGRPGAQVEEGRVILRRLGGEAAEEQYELSGTELGCSPNLENAAAAVLAARLAGIPPQAVTAGLAAFAPLPHRLALVAEIDGVRYFDDSKATNIGAVQSALRSFAGPVVLIAGGRDKGGDYRLLASAVRDKVKAMLLIGEASERMAAAFADITRVERLASLPAAVARAAAIAVAGDAVLLSPACASFDMFDSYAQRGDVFRQAVLRLQSRGAGMGAGQGVMACAS